ncbi:ABC transporter permease [Microbacterium sp. USHLN186]|uniref:ABC transporter permease n=1 Tax=Microbacterium sp. USHLN186 TaxID=3081286 RepID=UPI00301B48E9
MSASLGAPADGLFEVGQRPPFRAYLAEAWRRRTFAYTLAQFKIVSGLLQNRLGILWLVLRPLFMAAIYGTLFGALLSESARPDDWIPYVLTGTFTFQFFTGCFGAGSKSITSNSRLVQSLGFPRILLPVSVVLEEALRAIPIFTLLVILLPIFGVPMRWSWLLIIPILAMMALFNFGVALIVARMSVWTRDVQQFIPIVNRVLFYVSSIFFQVDLIFADNPLILTIAHLVPTYDFIAMIRGVTLVDHAVPSLALIAAPIWTVLALGIGLVYFWKAEARYGLSE